MASISYLIVRFSAFHEKKFEFFHFVDGNVRGKRFNDTYDVLTIWPQLTVDYFHVTQLKEYQPLKQY